MQEEAPPRSFKALRLAPIRITTVVPIGQGSRRPSTTHYLPPVSEVPSSCLPLPWEEEEMTP